MTALQELEKLGEVEVSTATRGGYRVRLDLGQWGNLRLQIFANGGTIDQAAEACRAKLLRVQALACAVAHESGMGRLRKMIGGLRI